MDANQDLVVAGNGRLDVSGFDYAMTMDGSFHVSSYEYWGGKFPGAVKKRPLDPST